MEAIQVRAAAAGARTLWLETLVHNTPAQRLYASLGYQPRRDLLFWRTDARAGQTHDASDLHAANVQEALVAAYAWQHQPPAWQRSQRAVARYQDELWAYKLQDAGETAGWVICLPTAPHHPGQTRLRIMTLAVRPGEQQTTLAHRLLASLRAHQPDTVLTVINEPETSLFTAALQDTGFVEMDRQIEMVLALQ
jgi:ribosomal protein S18 acetylase RimI-like enzyme